MNHLSLLSLSLVLLTFKFFWLVVYIQKSDSYFMVYNTVSFKNAKQIPLFCWVKNTAYFHCTHAKGWCTRTLYGPQLKSLWFPCPMATSKVWLSALMRLQLRQIFFLSTALPCLPGSGWIGKKGPLCAGCFGFHASLFTQQQAYPRTVSPSLHRVPLSETLHGQNIRKVQPFRIIKGVSYLSIIFALMWNTETKAQCFRERQQQKQQNISKYSSLDLFFHWLWGKYIPKIEIKCIGGDNLLLLLLEKFPLSR